MLKYWDTLVVVVIVLKSFAVSEPSLCFALINSHTLNLDVLQQEIALTKELTYNRRKMELNDQASVSTHDRNTFQNVIIV